MANFWEKIRRVFIPILFWKYGPTPASYSFIFSLFKQTRQFFQQINAKNVHPVYGSGIRTHNLSNMSCHPQPLDQTKSLSIIWVLQLIKPFLFFSRFSKSRRSVRLWFRSTSCRQRFERIRNSAAPCNVRSTQSFKVSINRSIQCLMLKPNQTRPKRWNI